LSCSSLCYPHYHHACHEKHVMIFFTLITVMFIVLACLSFLLRLLIVFISSCSVVFSYIIHVHNCLSFSFCAHH
ncbi:MAG: hypothetical protein ACKPKO_15025, partial [Candidatus Fonsibacter sp.]